MQGSTDHCSPDGGSFIQGSIDHCSPDGGRFIQGSIAYCSHDGDNFIQGSTNHCSHQEGGSFIKDNHVWINCVENMRLCYICGFYFCI